MFDAETEAPAPVARMPQIEASPVDQGEDLGWLAEQLPDEVAEPVDIPDWLQEGAPEEAGVLEDIFVPEDIPTPAKPVAAFALADESDIDTSDPWVEAFELEQQQGLDDIEKVPDWYSEKLGEEAPVVSAPASAPAGLADAALPQESALPVGELEPLPAWLAAEAPPEPVAAPIVSPVQVEEEPFAAEMPDWLKSQVGEGEPAVVVGDEELPDWLKSAGIGGVEEVPAWLRESISEEEAAPDVFMPPELEIAPQPVAPPVAQQPVFTPPPAPMPVAAVVSPAPAPPPPPAADVAAALASARSKFAANDVDGALADYESVVRANTQLDVIVSDLSDALKKDRFKQNASIHRVLGDGLMRLGRLQEALDTYRKALNLL